MTGPEPEVPLEPSSLPRPSPAELQGAAIRGSFWTAVHVAVSLPLAFLVNVVVARVLGVVDYGRLGVLMAVITIATTLATMGVGAALLQFGSKAFGARRTEEAKRLISGVQGYSLFVTAPLVTVAVLAIVRVDAWLLGLAIGFGVLLPAALQSAPLALAMESRSATAAKAAIVANLAVQGSVLTMVLTLGTPDAVWSGRVIATGIFMIVPLLLVRPTMRSAILHPRAPWTLPPGFWRFAVPIGLATLISTLVTDRTQLVYLDWLAEPTAVGLFALAFGLSAHIFAPAQAFLGPLVPALSSLAESDGARLNDAFLRASRCASVVAGFMTAAALPALAVLIPLFYGSEFQAAAHYVVGLGCGVCVVVATAPHYAFMMARLRGRTYLLICTVALAVGAVSALALIPLWGAWGAVASYLSGTLTRALAISILEWRHLNLGIAEIVRVTGSVPLAVLCTLMLWFLARPILTFNDLAAAGALAVLGGVGLLLSIRVLRVGLSSGDAASIAAVAPARLRRQVRRLLNVLVTC